MSCFTYGLKEFQKLSYFYQVLLNVINDDVLNRIVDEKLNLPFTLFTLIAMEMILHQTTSNSLNYIFLTECLNIKNPMK